ncbi:hypothetical protein FLM9_1074 [Candidatus Synechococcus spongiarum]|uniref:Uncharacterized protein n=1 Tax=Candidatus Synechococcus spongiarum TaxID=431041 RepID=A0A165B2U5_9SYNE|nr:hypothetical protein FLM9_1074 [Candidatus Synechococcus spongiarum]
MSYAASYESAWSGKTLLMIGGYEQDLSGLPFPIADLPRPAITASEVVDRETLRIFSRRIGQGVPTGLHDRELQWTSPDKECLPD